ncbi:MAG: putative sulfate exporter family transporter [Pseudonocardiaceae bacterium]|nr:putative sulfate exporter family transporter [Pseudonocardiaceae bacterium]
MTGSAIGLYQRFRIGFTLDDAGIRSTGEPSVSVDAPEAAPARSSTSTPLPGLALAVLVAVPASLLGRLVPVVGGPIFGLLLGVSSAVLLRRVTGGGRRLEPGFAVGGKQVLQLSIVLLGTGLPFTQVLRVGGESLPVMVGTLTVALLVAWGVGRALRVDGSARTLIGVGTGICGASAIAAVTSVITVSQAGVAYAVATIFVCNILAVVAFPAFGHLLDLSQSAFGVWSGTAINDTSSVVAAAYSYGTEAGDGAVVVKLARSLMIIPICLALVWWRRRASARRTEHATPMPWWRVFPLFIIGFLLASAARTVGLIPDGWLPLLAAAGPFLITVALTAIGFSLRLPALRQAGVRPLVLGLVVWLAVAASSLGLQALTGQL